MAELIFKKTVEERGISGSFIISSFGTSDCESHNVKGGHVAKQLSLKDVINADYILVMDSGNLFDVLRLTGGKFSEKIFKLCSFTSAPRDVADPWYTRDFERAYEDISDGCNAFLNYLIETRRV